MYVKEYDHMTISDDLGSYWSIGVLIWYIKSLSKSKIIENPYIIGQIQLSAVSVESRMLIAKQSPFNHQCVGKI